jgi:hypothetical protein
MAKIRSRLPELVELSPLNPLVTVPLGAQFLTVKPKAVGLMLAHLGGALRRELTGRAVTERGETSDAIRPHR